MSAQGTVQTVHRAQAPRVPRRGEHQSVVPVSAQPSLPKPSHGRRRPRRQKLHRGQYPNVFGILHARRTQIEDAKMIVNENAEDVCTATTFISPICVKPIEM